MKTADVAAKEPVSLEREPRSGRSAAAAGTSISSRTNSFNDAIKLPPNERAEVALADRFKATYLEPHRWPEIVRIFDAFNLAFGLPLHPPSSGDWSAIQAALRLVAVHHDIELIVSAIGLAPDDKFFEKPSHRRLTAVTPESLRPLIASLVAKPKEASGRWTDSTNDYRPGERERRERLAQGFAE